MTDELQQFQLDDADAVELRRGEGDVHRPSPPRLPVHYGQIRASYMYLGRKRIWMVFILALGAALANALTSVFQRMGVEDAPADEDAEAEPDDLRRTPGHLAPRVRPDDRLVHPPGRGPAFRAALAGPADLDPGAGLPGGRALRLVGLHRGTTRVARLAGVRGWPRRFLVLRPPRGRESLRLVLELADRRDSPAARASPWPSCWRCAARVGGVPPCSAPQAPSLRLHRRVHQGGLQLRRPGLDVSSTGTGRRTP